MIKLCIFDMDGTVVDSINSIAYFANKALEKFGFENRIDTETYKRLVGNGARVLISRMLDLIGAPRDNEDALFKYYKDLYDSNSMYLAKPYDGIIELLTALKEKNIKCAILSNKPHMAAAQISEGLFGNLVDICIGEKPEMPLKPDPSGVFRIMEKFGAKKSECLYIGDTKTDMETGKRSGLFTVGVLWGFRKEEELTSSGADIIVTKPGEILKIVDIRHNML